MEKSLEKITLNSRLCDIYNTTIGHDLISKFLLQLNIDEKYIKKGPLSRIKLKTVAGFTKKKIGKDFYDKFIKMINDSTEERATLTGDISHQWWKEAVFYQIYPRTFYDTNNDGIGDIQGIIAKLDYLKDIGVDCLWLSPIYDSPMDDNGYDIRDYRKILKEFGSMEDFDTLLSEVHKRGMKLIMDLVVNHSSDEHEWFQKALKDPSSKYHNYYHFTKKPNNWTSMFLGEAWNYYPEIEEYALHLFTKKQMDLNWDCAELREEVISMINWWLDKGIDGFRMDVINLISKAPGLPDGDLFVGSLMGITGIENYFYGPNLHKYLNEINTKAFTPHKAFSVGETPGIGIEMSRLVTGEERNELNMVFNFDHLETPGHTRIDKYKYDLNYYRDYKIQYMTQYGNNCWMSLFYNNHDNPKMCYKVNPESSMQKPVQKLLAVMQMTLKGSPFVYQGEEMGLTNYHFSSIDEINDVESKNHFRVMTEEKHMTAEEALSMIQEGTREHGRILLPWNEEAKKTSPLVAQQNIDEEIIALYKKLIKLRHDNPELVYGDFTVIDESKNKFTYRRGDSFIIDCNLCENKIKAYKVDSDYELIYPETVDNVYCSPYEARIYRKI